MAVDRRELILARLKVLLDEVKATNAEPFFAWRNRSEFDEGELPAYVLLDGIENNADVRTTGEQGGRRGPCIMRLEPQIFFVPLPTENQLNQGVGENLSAHRSKLLAKIMRDSTLSDILTDNGYIDYRSMDTDMQTGAEVKGQARLDIALVYPLDFTKL